MRKPTPNPPVVRQSLWSVFFVSVFSGLFVSALVAKTPKPIVVNINTGEPK